MFDTRHRINQILNHIEVSDEDPLGLEELASACGISPWHFVRVFQTLVGETPVAYQSRRRLARAARELAITDQRIIDIAINQGFSSQESFHRAFLRHYRITPGLYRKHLKHRPLIPSSNRIPVLRNFPLEPKITAKAPLTLEGFTTRVRNSQNNLAFFTSLWEEFYIDEVSKLKETNREIEAFAYYRFDQESDDYLYTIGWFNPQGAAKKKNTTLVEFPQALWARFNGTPVIVDPLVEYAWGEWLTSSGHQVASDDLGHVESHRFGRFTDFWDHRVWVPLSLNPTQE